MGLLDLPAPALSAINSWLAQFLPSVVLLLFWAALGAFLSMELYRLFSPQKRIAKIKLAFEQTRRHVAAFDGEFEEAWPHMRRMLSLALQRVALVFPATIVASLPLLIGIVWIDGQYGSMFPPSHATVNVTVPGDFQGRWVETNGGAPHAQVVDRDGRPLADIVVTKPVSVIHKRVWWNTLIGNPAGYLDDTLPFDRIDIALPRQQVLSFGPSWLRGWEAIFFAAMVLFALAFKTVRRIA